MFWLRRACLAEKCGDTKFQRKRHTKNAWIPERLGRRFVGGQRQPETRGQVWKAEARTGPEIETEYGREAALGRGRTQAVPREACFDLLAESGQWRSGGWASSSRTARGSMTGSSVINVR